MVRSHLEYAGSVWSPHKVSYIKKLEKVQMRVTKLFYPIRNLSYDGTLRYLNLPTLYYRRLRGDMITVYKMITGLNDNSAIAKLTRATTVTRGNIFKFNQGHVHYDLRKHSFNIRIISIWNSLPKPVVSACSVLNFEKNLDVFWSNQDCKFD